MPRLLVSLSVVAGTNHSRTNVRSMTGASSSGFKEKKPFDVWTGDKGAWPGEYHSS